VLYFLNLATVLAKPHGSFYIHSSLRAFFGFQGSMLNVVSANRLKDGTVVYLAPQGNWVEELDAAAVFASEAGSEGALEKARAAVSANLIVDPFVVAIVEEAGMRRAVSLRDAIRALGPTIEYGTAERR
jgi:hypothetical protein